VIRPTVLHRIEADDRDVARLVAAMTATRGVVARGRWPLVVQGARHRAALLHAHGIGHAVAVARAARVLRVPWVLSIGAGDLPGDAPALGAARRADLVIVASEQLAELVAAAGVARDRLAVLPLDCLVDLAGRPSAPEPGDLTVAATGLADPAVEGLLADAVAGLCRVRPTVRIATASPYDGEAAAVSVLLVAGAAGDPAQAPGLRRLVVGAQLAGTAIVVVGAGRDLDEVLPPGIALAVPAVARTLTRALVALVDDAPLRAAMARAGSTHAGLAFELGAAAADIEAHYRSLLTSGRPAPSRERLVAYPRVAVVMVTHNRRAQLREAVAGMRGQVYPADRLEFVVVDNASTDGSEADLAAVADDRLRVLREDEHQPPALARNRAVATTDAEIVVFTDDDCRPSPNWVASLAAGFGAGIGIVQGRTIPDPAARLQPLSRTQWTPAEYGLYETANVAYRREHLVGGPFDERFAGEIAKVFGRLFGRYPFAEDVELAWRVKRRGVGTRFASGAVVEHHVYPPKPSYLLRRAVIGGAGFPTLVREVPELRSVFLWNRVFVSRRSAATALAIVGGIVATKRPAAVVAAAPYAWSVLQPRRPGRKARLRASPVLVAQDVVQCGAAIYGSIRARCLVL
jgi:Glycosyl transferase family 2